MIKVLLVDDDRTLTRALSLFLTSKGLEVLTANTADSAAKTALHERPDVIVLDIDMPQYTGLELHQCLQFSDRGKKTPVVYLTGKSEPHYRQMALKLGAMIVLNKPSDGQTILDTIRSVLAT